MTPWRDRRAHISYCDRLISALAADAVFFYRVRACLENQTVVIQSLDLEIRAGGRMAVVDTTEHYARAISDRCGQVKYRIPTTSCGR